MSVQVSYKKQTLFTVLFLLVVYFVAEAAIQTYNLYNPNCKFMNSEVFSDVDYDLQKKICLDNDKILFQNKPLRNIPNQDLEIVNINSDGFRGQEITKEKQDELFRIFVVGGSTVLGNTATSDETTIPGWLQRLIDESDISMKVEVINAGIGGGFSLTEKNLIQDKLLEYEPDLFIVYDGWNDIDRPYSVHNEDSADYNLPTQILRNFVVKNEIIKIPGIIFKQYNFYKFANLEVYTMFNDENIIKKAEIWKDRWTEVCQIGLKKDFDVILALQPIVGTGEKILTDEEQMYFKKYDHEHLIPNYQNYADQLDDIDDVCKNALDLRNAFDSETKTIFSDSGHVGDEGNRIIAKKLFETVYPILQNRI